MTVNLKAKVTLTSEQNQYGPPEKAAQRQSDFEASSQKIVQKAIERIQTTAQSAAPSVTPNFVPLFSTFLSQFGINRCTLAKAAQTIDAELFGLLPKDEEQGNLFPYTALDGAYEKVNEVALQQLRERLEAFTFDGKTFTNTAPNKTVETVLNRQFSCEVQVFDQATMKARSAIDTEVDMPILQRLRREIERTNPNPTIFECVAFLKQNYPETYSRDRFKSFMEYFERVYPSPVTPSDIKYARNQKSHYALVTLRTQIGQKMFATGQWLTWLSQNGAEDPRVHLSNRVEQPVVLTAPQDVFLHEETKKECAKLFDQILHWNKSSGSVDELKNQMALFRYLFASMSPYLRGSAAVGEWFEESMYGFLGLKLTRHPTHCKDSVDVAAISTLKFSDYLAHYNRLVHVSGDSQSRAKPSSLEVKDPTKP